MKEARNCYCFTRDGYYAGMDSDYGQPLPCNGTYDKPEIEEGFVPRWNGEAWEQVENHKGESGYINGQPHEIKEYGPYPDGWSATPPPPTLDEAKQAKIAAIDRRTAEFIKRGFAFADKQFSMSEAAQRNWIALSSGMANGLLPFPMAVSTIDESSHVLTSPDELKAFLGAYLLYQADPIQPLGAGRALKERVTAAKTVEEVEAIVDARE